MSLDLDNPMWRRRALAARAVTLAESLRLAQKGGDDLGVPCPDPITPTSLKAWAVALERGNSAPMTILHSL